MEDLGWKGEAGVKPRSPKGRAVARGLDARIHFQHPFIPAGDTPPKSHQPAKIPLTVITVSTATVPLETASRLQIKFPEVLCCCAERAQLVDGAPSGENVNGSNGSASKLSRSASGPVPVETCGLNFSPAAFCTNVDT